MHFVKDVWHVSFIALFRVYVGSARVAGVAFGCSSGSDEAAFERALCIRASVKIQRSMPRQN